MLDRHFLQRTSVRILILTATLVFNLGFALADEGTVQVRAKASDGYCNLKIPAIRPSTLASGTPELKSSATGDVIDFYGPCDYDAKGKDEVAAQKRYRSSHYVKF